MPRSAKNEVAGTQHPRIDAGIIGSVWRTFGDGGVSSFIDETSKFDVRYRMLVHPKSVNRDFVDRTFFRVKIVGSHLERAAANPGHLPERRLGPRYFASRLCHARASPHNVPLVSLRGEVVGASAVVD